MRERSARLVTGLTRSVLLAAFALVACGGDKADLGAVKRYPVPGCEAFDPAPCDVLTNECQARLYGLAACLRGSVAGDVPPVVVMSQAEYEAELEAAAAAEEPPKDQMEWEWALVALGLIQPGALESAARVSADVSFIAGFYDPKAKVVNVIDHGSSSTPESSSSVILHEFVHALQDSESDLASFTQAHYGTYDSAFAADAIIEGEAKFHEQRYEASMLGFDPASVDWDALFQNAVDAAESKLLGEDSAFTAANRDFPYAWGARYIHLGWDASGHAGVLDLFAAPPAHARVEMASVTALTEDVAGPDIDAPTPPAEWTELGDDRFGALGVFELVGRHAAVGTARSIALDWRADHVVLYGGAEQDNALAIAVVWLCDFGSAESALAAASFVQQTSGLTVNTQGTRLVVSAASDGSSLAWALGSAQP